MAARYGGEEFVLLMPNTGVSGAVAASERYRRRIANLSLADSVRTESIRVGRDQHAREEHEGAITIRTATRWSIEAPPGGAKFQVTASFGVAAFPEHEAHSVEDLLRLADRALYRAKALGRNCVVVAEGRELEDDAADG